MQSNLDGIDQVVVLNTIGQELPYSWVTELDCTGLFIEAIVKDSKNESISSMFNQTK